MMDPPFPHHTHTHTKQTTNLKKKKKKGKEKQTAEAVAVGNWFCDFDVAATATRDRGSDSPAEPTWKSQQGKKLWLHWLKAFWWRLTLFFCCFFTFVDYLLQGRQLMLCNIVTSGPARTDHLFWFLYVSSVIICPTCLVTQLRITGSVAGV